MTKLTEERIKELRDKHCPNTALVDVMDLYRAIEAELQPDPRPENLAAVIDMVGEPVQEPVGEVIDPTHVHLYNDKQLPYGTKLYTAPPDQTAEIERLKQELLAATFREGMNKERIATLDAALREAKVPLEQYQSHIYRGLLYPTRETKKAIATINKALGEV